MKEQFKEILVRHKRDELIPFLKKLTEKEKKELASFLGKTDIYPGGENRSFFIIAGLYCCTLTQFKKITRWFTFNFYNKDMELVNEFLEFHRPGWFQDYFDQQASEEQLLDYGDMLHWQEKGFLDPSPGLIAKSLGEYNATQPLDIEKYPVIREHIYTLFEYENNIGYTDSYYENKNGEKFYYRLHEIVKYANEGNPERIRLIKGCLQTVNHNFQKNQIGWNTKLLAILNPTQEELILLQDELYHALTGNNSAFQNQTLQEISKIITHPSFQPDAFADALPILLSQTVKKTLQAALQIIEKVVQTHPAKKERYTNEVAQLFLNKDQTLQTKAAKFILRYGDSGSPDLQETITNYTNYILPSVKQLLKDFIREEANSEENEIKPAGEPATQVIISDENRIPVVNNFEELLYFAIQAFSGTADFYPVMLPYYLLVFDKELTAEQVEQLEPVYKKIQQAAQRWGVDKALSDDVLMCFMGDYAAYLAGRYPDQTQRMLELVKKEKIISLKQWKSRHSDDLFRYPVYYHLSKIWEAIGQGDCYQPLSTPTHTPLWIDPVVLVQRLILYQQEGREPNNYDLQAAIQNCCLQNTQEACKEAMQLQGEIRELILFLFGAKEFDQASAGHPAWWVTAAFTRYQGTLPPAIRDTGWDIPDVFFMPLNKWKIAGPDKTLHIFDKNALYVSRENTNFAYTDQFYLYKRLNTIPFKGGDMYRVLISHPYHHQQVLARFLEIVTVKSAYSNNEAEMIKILQAIRQLQQPFGEMEHLAVALSFFNKQKEIGQYGADLYIESLRNGWSNPAQAGEALGKIITSDWLPLKRFTTLLQNNLMAAGNDLNTPLLEMIESTLRNTRQTTTGFKVILEVYKELLINTKRHACLDQFPLYKEWESNSGLKKIIKELTTV